MATRAEPASGAAVEPTDHRRARGVLALLARALPDDAVALALAGDEPVRATPARVVFRSPKALGRALWPPTADALGDAYLRGEFDVEGEIAAVAAAGKALDLRRLRWGERARLVRDVVALRIGAGPVPRLRRRVALRGRRHSPARDRAAVRFHYDAGNAFYSLWLDHRLTYSCAYFASPGMDLDAAQEAKLDLVCRKLALRPGRRLLDIGCGWGSLIVFAAARYGVEAVGVTLSEPQAEHANALAARAGLAGRVRAEVRDYRELAPLGAFDAVASIGMFEHVGRGMLPRYFAAARSAVRPGGLFLNHGIATSLGPRRALTIGRESDFVGRHVFPDGELLEVDEAVARARGAGFEIIDVQSLRPHYALTLAAWVRRLEAERERAIALVGEEVYRTWRLYMAGSRVGFERAELDVAQLLLARPSGDGPADLPLRPWW